MINIKKTLIAGLVALSASSVMAYQDSGFYLGAGAGGTKATDLCHELSGLPGTTCDDDDFAWSAFGGYQINRYFAVEAGYSNLGSLSAGATDGTDWVKINDDIHALDLSLLAILPINQAFSVYARGGYSEVYNHIDVHSSLGSGSDSSSEGDWTYGAGIGLNITDNLEMHADWRRYQDIGHGSAMDSSNIDLDVFSIQGVYHFGAKPAPAPVAAPAEEVSLNIQVLFDFDKSVIKPEYQGEVQKAVDYLNAHPEAKAVIEGHTDSVGTDAYNQALSERRANAVMNAMIAKGIAASRLSAVGYGESKPVADNATKEGRAQNRRVVAEFSGVSIKAN